MRIVFLSSSIEPGRDGVGDYVRCLAGELIRTGHQARLVSLADPFVGEPLTGIQQADAVSVETLRLSRSMSWDARVASATAWIEAFAPDWVSMQFVCFGFHPRGILHEAAIPLRTLCSRFRMHWMFHELWLGLAAAQTWKFKPWGMIQRHYILQVFRSAAPRTTHTNTEWFARILQRHGIRAKVLPLFSSIPVQPCTGRLETALEGLGIRKAERRSWILLGVFGTIHGAWSQEGWLDRLIEAAKKQGRRIAILGIGRLGPANLVRFQALAGGRQQGLVVHHFGEQAVEQVSEFLQTIDVGVSTMERSLLGKSSTAAAMAEHNVPLLVTRIDDEPDRERARARVWRAIDTIACGDWKELQPQTRNSLESTVETLLRDLGATLVTV